MSVTISATYRHDGLAYQMNVTENGGRPQDKDVEIEYLGHPQSAPLDLNAYWSALKSAWEVKAEIKPYTASGFRAFRSHVEDLQIAVDMAREFREILNAE